MNEHTKSVILDFLKNGEAFLKTILDITDDNGAIEYFAEAGVNVDEFEALMGAIEAIGELLKERTQRQLQ